MSERWRAARDVDDALASLAVVERHCLPGLSRARRNFVRIGSTLVQQRFLNGTLLPSRLGLRRLQPLPPPLRRIGTGRALLANLAGGRYRAPSAAEAIRLDRNVRGFYLADGTTIKLQASADQEALAHEVGARRAVDRTQTVRVPRIIACELAAPQPFICEALVAGRRPHGAADDARIAAEVLPSFCRLYRMLGISEMRVASFFDLDRIRDDALACLQALPVEETRRAGAARWLERIDRLADAVLPAAPCHGDLSHGNMIVDAGGAIWVVDWETARTAPVLWDWRKLCGTIPASLEVYARFLAELHPRGAPQAMPPLHEQDRLVQAALLAEVASLVRVAPPAYARRRIAGAVRQLLCAFGDTGALQAS